jgi:hypothetical protein
MWMNSYLQDTMIRDHILEAQRRAARRHLLRPATPRRSGARLGLAVRQLVDRTPLPRLKRLIERTVLP